MTLTRREILTAVGGVSTVSLSRFFAEFDWLEVGEMDVDSLSTDNLRTDSRVPDVVVWTDGSTYYAEGPDDTVASSTDPEPVLQQAIDHPASDPTVYVGRGRFEANNVVPRSGLTLHGAGEATTFVCGTDSSNLFFASDGNNRSNIEMGYYAVDVSSDADFATGHMFDNVQDVEIHHTRCYDSNAGTAATNNWTIAGIQTRVCDDVNIHHNLMERTQIKAMGSGPGKNITVANNISRDANKNSITVVARKTGTTLENVTVTDNVIEDAQEIGIFIGTDGDYADGATFRNMTVSDNVLKGSFGSHQVLVSDYLNTTWENIAVSGNLLISRNTGGSGIRVEAPNVEISDNGFVGRSGGPVITGGASELSVESNRFVATDEISLNGSSYVRDNYFTDPTGSGSKFAVEPTGDIFLEFTGNTVVSWATGTQRVLETANANAPTIRAFGNEFRNPDGVTMNIYNGTAAASTPDTVWMGNIHGDGVGSTTFAGSGKPLYNWGIDEALSAAPYGTPEAGDIYLDDGTNTGDAAPHYRYYDGTAWNDL